MPTPDHVSLLRKSVSIAVHLEAKESRRKKMLKRQNWNKFKKENQALLEILLESSKLCGGWNKTHDTTEIL